jgi:hypothetical protein
MGIRFYVMFVMELRPVMNEKNELKGRRNETSNYTRYSDQT